MESIIKANLFSLKQLEDLLKVTDPHDYRTHLAVLNHASIGMHVRHVLEFYDLLLNSLSELCYDNRRREKQLEEDLPAALEHLGQLKRRLALVSENRGLILKSACDPASNQQILIETNLARELAYNLEHCIHHMALIRIGVEMLNPQQKLPDSFGLAPATLRARKMPSMNKS